MPCACLPPPLVHRVVIIDSLLHCADFFVCLFVCFHRNRICCPSINQTSPSQSEGLFPFIIICRQKKYLQTGTLGLCMSAWTENNLCIHWKIISTWHIMVKFGSHKYKKITWLDKNQALRMILSCITSCEDHELWKLSTVFSTGAINLFLFLCVFFSYLGFPSQTFTNHRTAGEEGNLLTPHYHFLPLHRHLDISQANTAQRSPLHISNSWTWTGNLWFPSASR